MKNQVFIKIITCMSIIILLSVMYGCGGSNPTAGAGTGGTPITTPPAIPLNASATAGNTQNTITWNMVSGATSYKVYFAINSVASTSAQIRVTNQIASASTSNYQRHTGLTNGTTYSYVVTAVNTAGESLPSNVVSAIPLASLLPPPTNVTTTAKAGFNVTPEIIVSWNSVTGATGYKIYSSTTTPVIPSQQTLIGTTLAIASTSFNHIGVNIGVRYYYVITAYNANGESLPSLETPSSNMMIAVNNKHLMGGTIQGVPLVLTGTLTTIAGMIGASGSANGTGLAASFNAPEGITIDTNNNLYIVDLFNNMIRKIDYNVAVTTVAGSTAAGYIDATGQSARFNLPFWITTDGSNLYVPEALRIRKIDAFGNVTTLSGSGIGGHLDGPATSAQFSGMGSITTDNTYLYVSEGYANASGTRTLCIRKIWIFDGSVTTITLPASWAGRTSITGLTTDGNNLYIANYNAVYKMNLTTGTLTCIAGHADPSTVTSFTITDGIGTGANFSQIDSITTDGTSLYVSDYDFTTTTTMFIRKIDISTGNVTTVKSGLTGRINALVTDGTSLFMTNTGFNHYTIDKMQ